MTRDKNYPLPFLCKWLYHVSCIKEKVEKCLLYLSALWLVNLLYGPLTQKLVWIKIFPHFFNPKITNNYLTNFISLSYCRLSNLVFFFHLDYIMTHAFCSWVLSPSRTLQHAQWTQLIRDIKISKQEYVSTIQNLLIWRSYVGEEGRWS